MATKVPKVITLEGIIASGKTTLLSKLEKNLSSKNYKIKIVPEPVESWENVTNFKPHSLNFLKSSKLFKDNDGIINGDHSRQSQFYLLSEMYKDPNRWCLSFQLWALFTRISSIEAVMNECMQKNEDIDLLLIERSSTANRIFASLMYDNNDLNECEWFIYNHFFDYFDQKSNYLLDGIIYLNCPLDIAMNRLAVRNRKGEENVSREYQQQLKQKHDEWLLSEKNEISLFDLKIPYDDDAASEVNTFERINDFLSSIKTTNIDYDRMKQGDCIKTKV